MSKYTPGPWRFGSVITAGKEFDGIAQIIDNTKWENGVVEANALLIAAAPEMLEALKQAVDQFEREYVNTPLDGHFALIQKLRAVISKAQG